MSRRLVTAAAVAAGALALTGCGTGLSANVYKQAPYREFQDAALADLSIRNLAISAPDEGITISTADEAVLTGAVVSTGGQDALISVETPIAAKAQLQVDGVDVSSVEVPAGGATASDWTVVLTGLSRELRSGEYVDVTLTFQKAGETKTLSVPVRSGDTGLEDREPAQDPYGGGEE